MLKNPHVKKKKKDTLKMIIHSVKSTELGNGVTGFLA